MIYIPYSIATLKVIKTSSSYETYIPKVGVDMMVCWMIWYVILSCLVSDVHFNCRVQDFLYPYMDKGNMWYCALVSCTPSQSVGLYLGVHCSGVECHCSFYYFFDRILIHHDFHHDSCDYHWDFYGHSFHFEMLQPFCHYVVLVLQNAQLPECFSPWTLPFEYWIENVIFGLLYVMFTSSNMIFYRGVPGFAIDRRCCVSWHGLTICLLYVGQLFGNLG